MEKLQDQWAQWLLQRRHGGDPDAQQAMLRDLFSYRDQVLLHANVAEGETLLDVGAGDGLIAFGALPLVGASGKVIFSDVSQDLLDHCQALAQQMGLAERCRFVCLPAEHLGAIEDASVDVATTRSVLIYVPNKQQALREFHRVLKPGGRISLFEPINRFSYPEPPQLFYGCDVSPVLELAGKVKACYGVLKDGCEDSMLSFDERDLLAWAEQAGFGEMRLELQVEIVPLPKRRWETFARQAPNPLAPTLEEVMNYALTPAETAQLVAHLRPLIEEGRGTRRTAIAYLWAKKSVDEVIPPTSADPHP